MRPQLHWSIVLKKRIRTALIFEQHSFVLTHSSRLLTSCSVVYAKVWLEKLDWRNTWCGRRLAWAQITVIPLWKTAERSPVCPTHSRSGLRKSHDKHKDEPWVRWWVSYHLSDKKKKSLGSLCGCHRNVSKLERIMGRRSRMKDCKLKAVREKSIEANQSIKNVITVLHRLVAAEGY